MSPNQQPLDRIIEEANQSDLSTIRSVVVKILGIINDPSSTAKELVDVIHVDPPLAAKVLKLVNSAHCAPRSKICGLQQAVIFIGFETLKEMALSQKVCEIFQKSISIQTYSRKALWKHSVAVALFAKQIYRKEFGEKGDTAYATGLLHDIGIIVEDQFCNDAFIAALDISFRKSIPLWKAEKDVIGFDHAEIGMSLLDNWQLASSMATAIGSHHLPADTDDIPDQLTACLYIANHCCQSESLGFSDAAVLDVSLYEHCLRFLELNKLPSISYSMT